MSLPFLRRNPSNSLYPLFRLKLVLRQALPQMQVLEASSGSPSVLPILFSHPEGSQGRPSMAQANSMAENEPGGFIAGFL